MSKVSLFKFKKVIYYLLIVLWCSISFSKMPDLPGLSQKWIDFVNLDWNYNVPGRSVMPDSERKVRSVYKFALNGMQFKSILKYENSPVSEMYQIIDKKETYLIGDGLSRVLSGLRISRERLTSLKAVKLQSWSTFLVWNPKDPNFTPFFLKMNGWDSSIAMELSTYFESSFRNNNEDLLDYFTEPLGVESVNFPGLNQSYRFLRDDQKDKTFLPLHGYIGLLLKNNKQEFIITKLMPMIGRAMARLHFKYGSYHCSHTQNLLVQVNPNTGTIEKIVIRDLRDIYPDPLVVDRSQRQKILDLISKNKELYTFGKATPDNRIKNREVGFFLMDYLGQTVNNPFKRSLGIQDTIENLYSVFTNSSKPTKSDTQYLAWRSNANFMISYLEEAEQIIGSSIPDQLDSQRRLLTFFKGIVDVKDLSQLKSLVNEFTQGNPQFKNSLGLPDKQTRETIFDLIAGTIREMIVDKISHSKNSEIEQEALNPKFLEIFKITKNLSVLNPVEFFQWELLKTNEKLVGFTYEVSEDFLFLKNKTDGKVIAIVYFNPQLNIETKSLIDEKLINETQGIGLSCESSLSND